jgi:methyl-accepting chemotaxis protein
MRAFIELQENRREAMDLNIAIQKHAEWKFKFREALHNHQTMEASTIGKDNQCELGKWLHGEAQALYSKHPEFAPCVNAHAAFHAEAGKVAAQVTAGKIEVVELMLASNSSFSEASKKVSVCIIALKNRIGQ